MQTILLALATIVCPIGHGDSQVDFTPNPKAGGAYQPDYFVSTYDAKIGEWLDGDLSCTKVGATKLSCHTDDDLVDAEFTLPAGAFAGTLADTFSVTEKFLSGDGRASTYSACFVHKPSSASTASVASAATGRYLCAMTDTNAAPYYTFIVNATSPTKASITYVRSAFFGSEEVQVEQPIESCAAENNQTVKVGASSIYIECAGDGDGGYLDVKRHGHAAALTGHMSFPNSGPGDLDSVSLPVTCTKSR